MLDTKSNFIIVPCTALYNSILRTSETINELKEVNRANTIRAMRIKSKQKVRLKVALKI